MTPAQGHHVIQPTASLRLHRASHLVTIRWSQARIACCKHTAHRVNTSCSPRIQSESIPVQLDTKDLHHDQSHHSLLYIKKQSSNTHEVADMSLLSACPASNCSCQSCKGTISSSKSAQIAQPWRQRLLVHCKRRWQHTEEQGFVEKGVAVTPASIMGHMRAVGAC